MENGAAASFEFSLNDKPVRIAGLPATTTLLDWLRRSGRTGSKCGCAEGDCGACTVAIVDRDAAGRPAYRAINSCIALLPMFAGREVVTVEGLADGDALHPVQREMVEHQGSQCGYCTPGFVVSLFEAYYRPEVTQPCQINDQLCGNLCRCTGYRPIRDAAVAALAGRGANPGDRFLRKLATAKTEPDALAYAAAGERFFRPQSLAELLALKARHADAVLIAGATEIGVELNKKFKKFPTLISTEGVPELTRIVASPTEWRIGAAATLTAVEEALGGAGFAPDSGDGMSGIKPDLQPDTCDGMSGAKPDPQEFPSLAKMLCVFAARQIRNRATLGGNLATASPIGDSAPVLLTLDASVVLASAAGERTVPLHEFFTGYRRTQLQIRRS